MSSTLSTFVTKGRDHWSERKLRGSEQCRSWGYKALSFAKSRTVFASVLLCNPECLKGERIGTTCTLWWGYLQNIVLCTPRAMSLEVRQQWRVSIRCLKELLYLAWATPGLGITYSKMYTVIQYNQQLWQMTSGHILCKDWHDKWQEW